MRFSVILRYSGIILLLGSAFMLLSTVLAVFNDMDAGFYPLLLSTFIASTVGAFPLIFVPKSNKLSTKELYVTVFMSWGIICLFGTLPYMLYGGEFSFINAWFESVSGYTTTGATILNEIESLPRSLLFYRSSTHWLGGVGVVVFALLVAPLLKFNRLKLFKIETNTLAHDNFKYKAYETTKIIIKVYVLGTALCGLLLFIAGMDWFDSINHAFSTLATAGFSTKNASIGSFNNNWIYIIIIFFMTFSGVHFGLLYSTFTGKYFMFRSPIVRYYFVSIIIASIIVSLNTWLSGVYPSYWEALLHGLFHISSQATTTGFATTDTTLWPAFSMLIMLFMMLQTACVGSTAGGLKVDRIFILYKSIRAQITKQQHPNAIIPVRVGNVIVDEEVRYSITIFILFYILIFFAAAILLTLTGIDLTSSFSASIASLSNVGSAFGGFGSMGNYSELHSFGKMILTVLMLTGRLEIYGFLLIFFIRSWK